MSTCSACIPQVNMTEAVRDVTMKDVGMIDIKCAIHLSQGKRASVTYCGTVLVTLKTF